MSWNRRVFTAGAVPVAALAGALSTALFFGGTSRPLVAQESATALQEDRATATSLENAFMEISDKVGPATVSISVPVERPRRPESEDELSPFDLFQGPAPRSQRPAMIGGSGVIVRPEGYVVTNDHVVERARDGKVKVTLENGDSYDGTVIRDELSDLAVVKITTSKPLPFVRFADSRKLHVGQWAIAIGSPFGQQNTMTTGIVSALHRKTTIQGRPYPELLQTDASINPGNSGGPLLNIKGELIGVNVAIDSPTGVSAGIGFAIPSNQAKNVVDQLIAKGRVVRGYLGLTPGELTPDVEKKLGSDKGALVLRVAEGSPAAAAGIQVGDVVTRFGEQDVRDEYQLRRAIADTAPGTKVSLQLVRDGKTLTVSVTPTERDDIKLAQDLEKERAASQITAAKLGFAVGELTAKARQDLGIKADERGLLVTKVDGDSVAAKAGLTAGISILSINRVPVTSGAALDRVLGSLESGMTVMLRVAEPATNGKPAGRRILLLTVP